MEVNVEDIFRHGDHRVDSWPMMQSPKTCFMIVVQYLLFIKVIGPMWMRNKMPYELRMGMILYNAAMVVSSLWMFINFASLWFTNYSWTGQPTDYTNSDFAIKAAFTVYVYHLSKYVELLDTIFFVLRKKYSQVSFLHSFHHALLPVVSWYFLKYGGGGYVEFSMINVFVHIWMYSYYGLSAVGPFMQKYLWWKKYLTTLQLVQFVIIMAIFIKLILFRPENSTFYIFPAWVAFSQGVVFFILFSQFYRTTYKKSPKTSKKDIQNDVEHKNGCTVFE